MIAVRIVREGAVVRESVHRDLPIRLGRSRDNDVVLFDESASRLHAVIERDAEGRLVLRDLGSRNGIRHGSGAVAAVALNGLTRLHLGGVELELQTLSGDDTQEIERPAAPVRDGFRSHLNSVALGTLAWLMLAATSVELWSPWEKNRSGNLLGHAIGALFLQPIAAFLLLMLLRAIRRQVGIGDTLRALARVLWIFPLQAWAALMLYYVLPLGAFSAFDEWLPSLTTGGLVIYLAEVGRRGRLLPFRVAWAICLAVLIGGLTVVGRISARREGQPQGQYHVQVPLGRFTGPTGTLDGHISALRKAAERAARQADEVHRKQE